MAVKSRKLSDEDDSGVEEGCYGHQGDVSEGAHVPLHAQREHHKEGGGQALVETELDGVNEHWVHAKLLTHILEQGSANDLVRDA